MPKSHVVLLGLLMLFLVACAPQPKVTAAPEEPLMDSTKVVFKGSLDCSQIANASGNLRYRLHGKITDADGKPQSGVTVTLSIWIKNTKTNRLEEVANTQTKTDSDGKYSAELKVPEKYRESPYTGDPKAKLAAPHLFVQSDCN